MQRLFFLYLTVFINMIGFSMIFPMLPFYAESFKAGILLIGFLAAAHPLANFLSAPFLGRISDRVGRKPILISGALGAMAAMALMGFANSLLIVLLGRLLSGASASAIMPTARAYMGDVTTKAARVSGMGKIGAAMAAGQLFGPAFSSFLVGLGGIHVPFFVAAGVSFLNSLLILLFLSESLKIKSKKLVLKEGFFNIFIIFKHLRSEAGILFLVMCIWALSMSNNQVALTILAQNKFQFGPQNIGYLFTIAAVISILMQGYFLPKVVRFIGEKKTLLLGMLVMGTAMFFIPSFNGVFLFIGSYMLMTLGSTLNRPVAEGIVSRTSKTGQGTTMGIAQSFESLGRIIGPSSSGFLYEFTPLLPFFFAGSLLFLVAFISLVFLRIPQLKIEEV